MPGRNEYVIPAPMKKYTPHLVILVILTLASIYLLRTRQKGTYRSRDRDFAVEDTSAVRYIEISRNGESLILGKEASTWRVNAVLQADPVRIKGLMMLLSKLEVTAPVSNSLKESIHAGLDTDAISVKIIFLDGSGKSYRVYHDSGRSEKTYMLLDGSDIPFSMGVRGYPGSNLEEFYVINSRYWRDNTLVHFSPHEIKYVYLEHKRDPDASFHLDRDGSGSFLLAGGVLPPSAA